MQFGNLLLATNIASHFLSIKIIGLVFGFSLTLKYYAIFADVDLGSLTKTLVNRDDFHCLACFKNIFVFRRTRLLYIFRA